MKITKIMLKEARHKRLYTSDPIYIKYINGKKWAAVITHNTVVQTAKMHSFSRLMQSIWLS